MAVDSAELRDDIAVGQALASRTISNLPDFGFRITVKVTAGDVDLGTIVVARKGDPSHIKGAAFNMACLVDMDGDTK